jgi:hypothetical protein
VTWAGVSIREGLPVCGGRVNPRYVEDESFYWSYDEDLYVDLF